MLINTVLNEEDRLILLEYYRSLRPIVAVKPEHNPPKLLTNYTDGIHPSRFNATYIRRFYSAN